MYFPRDIDNELIDWKLSNNRKPLMIRGARQVGKSSSVRNLARSFRHFIEINFDENPRYIQLFSKGFSVQEICAQISLLTNTPVVPGDTLLFLDEIQACVPAISQLRYFYERMPELHIISAGSLLEFALSEIPSFGIGRVRSMFMHPLSFSEFLRALGEGDLAAGLQRASIGNPLFDPVHEKLLLYYKKFLIIGGMPEAVSTFVGSGDLLEVQRVLSDLVIAVQTDFAKYKARVSPVRLLEVFNAVASQTGQKFTYTFPNSTQSIPQVKEALGLLNMAGLIIPVTHSTANGLPLGAAVNVKKTKYLVFDTGIFQRMQGLDIGELMLSEDLQVVNKGCIAELHVGLELLKSESCYEKAELFYWQREAKNSQAEVDYVVQSAADIFPVEVKSGTRGSMQSLYIFLQEKKRSYGCRLSLENFSIYGQVLVVPLYAACFLKILLKRFSES